MPTFIKKVTNMLKISTAKKTMTAWQKTTARMLAETVYVGKSIILQ